MNASRLQLRDVRFAYESNAWALALPRLQFGEEHITCIVGPNGSGKSTLLRIAAGILRPTGGMVTLNERPIAAMSRREIARGLGFLPQETPPLFDFSVEAIARMGRYPYLRGMGFPTEADLAAVHRALSAVDLVSFRKRLLSNLSGGERRRALIASVLAQEPEILLLDEPTSSLDIHHATALMRLLARFGKDGPAVVIVTHDINLAALFSERLLLLVDGRIHADGSPRDVVRTEVMQEAYGEDILVQTHPETGGPMILPRRESLAEGSGRHA